MKKPVWVVLAATLPFAAVLIANSAYYLPFLSDDALISLRYARRLLDGHGLTWTEGPRVEGYSNLLWVLLVAAAGQIGVDLIDAARALGLLGMSTILLPLAIWTFHGRSWSLAWWPLTISLLFVALAAPVAVWAIGGLEQPLVGGLLAISLPLAYTLIERDANGVQDGRTAVWLSLVLGLLCLTRPDGALFAVVAAGSLGLTSWTAGRRPLRLMALVLLCPVLFSAAQLLFRIIYYGAFVPNTALVKIAASATHWQFGLDYLTSGFWAFFPLSALAGIALAAMLVVRSTRARGVLLATTATSWALYVAFIGGDFFPAYRHLIPLVVVAAFALADGALLLATQLTNRRAVFAVVAVSSFLAFVPYVRTQINDKWVRRAHTERWEWQGKEVALLLKEVFGPQQPTMAVTAAGCLPYWSELPALDMMGLNDYYLPRNRPADFGRGMVGHELGDGAYVLRQRPDLIVFDVGSPDPSWRTGEQLKTMPDFTERYVPVTLVTTPSEYRAVIFIDRYSTRVGIARSAGQITVPTYLATGPDAVAVDRAGVLTLRLTGTRPATLTFVVDDDVHLALDEDALRQHGAAGTLTQEGDKVSITLRSTRSEPVELQRLVLTAAPRPRPGVPVLDKVIARPAP